LCEAAGFELVLIETVGVGQAEQAVRDVCDTLVMLTLAGAGDEVQGIKRGLLEVADAVIVNKADGPTRPAAEAHAHELAAALSLLRPGMPPHVAAASASTGLGVPELWRWLSERFATLRQAGELATRRQAQLQRAFAAALSNELRARAVSDARFQQLLPQLEAAVAAGRLLPTAAARELATALFQR
jgi:LAO/AO transport system kinase